MPSGVYKRTIEHKAKLSAAHKGRKVSAATRAKISTANKGRIKSTEECKHLSEALMGHKYSEATTAKMRAAKLGKKYSAATKAKHRAYRHTNEQKKKISESHMGYKFSVETKAKMSAAQLGPKSASWLGGISFEPYTPKFNNQLKREIRERDNHICQLCSKTREELGRELCVHHIDYIKSHCNPENLTTLCRSCNVKVNTNRKEWQQYFECKMIA